MLVDTVKPLYFYTRRKERSVGNLRKPLGNNVKKKRGKTVSLPKPTIVIFDMDGTTVRHLYPAILHVVEFLDDTSFKFGRIWNWLFRLNKKDALLPGAFDKRKKKPRLLVHRAIHKIRSKPVEQIVEPCPGIYDTLDFLKAHKIPLALVSNGLGQGYGHDILKKFKLKSYFKTTIFREDIQNSKPNPESLLLAVKDLRIKLTSKDIIWYIGDRRKDVLAAQALSEHTKAQIVPIAYGLNAAVAVLEKNLGPENIIMSWPDITKLLTRLLGKPAEKKKKKTAKKKKSTKKKATPALKLVHKR